MHSLPIDKLPNFIVIDGEKCFLKTDFKNWIKFEIIITDANLSDGQKLMAALPLCFRKLPSSLEVAVKACLKFYCGDGGEKRGNPNSSRPLYSFLYDGDLIFSAFMSHYGIDLCDTEMHWYKFRALFKGLGPDTKFAEVVHIRSINLSDIKDGELRKKYRELKGIWQLPDMRSEKEKREDIVRAVEGAI